VAGSVPCGSDGGGSVAQRRRRCAGIVPTLPGSWTPGEDDDKGERKSRGSGEEFRRERIFAAGLERRHLGMFGVGDAFKEAIVVRRTGKPGVGAR